MLTIRPLAAVFIVLATAGRWPACVHAQDSKPAASEVVQNRNAPARFISPNGSGSRSGADADNAAKFTDIDEMIRLAGPGGTVRLLADAGPYLTTDSLTISHGGTAGHPVTITGIDRAGKPAKAQITGTRTSPYPTSPAAFATMKHGTDVFRLRSGADHLSFSLLEFQDVGNGAFYVQAKISGLTLEDIAASNVRRFLERATSADCTITGLTIRRVTVEGYSKSAIRLDGDTSRVLLEDVVGDSQRQDFDNFTEGVDLSGGVHDVVLRRCIMRNSQQTLGPEKFWNGDGFTSEKDTHDIVFEDCEASGNTDAGFDLKSSKVTLLRCKSFGNSANFKLWGAEGVVMRECVSENPVYYGGVQGPRHVTATWGANILVEGCRFTDQEPRAIVFHTDDNHKKTPAPGAVITVTNSKVNGAGRLSVVDSNSKVLIDGVARPFDRR